MLANGCATKALWQNDSLEAWNEPANDPHLRLFEANPPRDILVVYDEYCERSGVTHTRAYWLNENQNLMQQRHSPHFISTNSAFCLATVPVFTSPQINLPVTCAVLETNRQSFTLYSSGDKITSHDLPFYNDGKGKVEKFFLTPAAVTADCTVVGAILGYAYLGGFSPNSNPSY